MYLNPDCRHLNIETERLLLRPFCQEDLNDFFAYAKGPDVGEWAGWIHHKNIEESKTILNMFITENHTLAVYSKFDGKVIGSIGLDDSFWSSSIKGYEDGKTIEIGYVLSKNYWGKGLMTEAVKAVIDYLFSNTDVDFLTICHWVKNLRSERVIEKCGFVFLEEGESKTRIDDNLRKDRRYILTRDHYLEIKRHS